MKRFISPVACAAAILLSGVSVDAILMPAAAQGYVQVDFDMFHHRLARYGDWVYSDRWGEVWIPTDVPDDFRPYGTDGHWVYTDEYGWLWDSDYEWGDIPFHYGRWVNDPDDGWLWIPGYVWSPGWVVWRSNGEYVGWMPMPPDRQFLGGGVSVGLSFGRGFGLSFDFGNTNSYYGYSQWYGPDYGEDRFASNWIFVGLGHLDDRDYRRYRAPRAQYTTIIQNTTNITNYTVTNNYIVNKSISPQVVQRASGRPVHVMRAAEVIRQPELITTANQGREIQARMREKIPHGTGAADSAPKPTPEVIQSLSPKIAPRNGRPMQHLYTRETVTNAPLPNKRGGTPPSGQAAPENTTGPGNMMGPGEREKMRPGARENAPAGNMEGPGGNTNTMTGPGGMNRMERERRAPTGNTMAPQSPATTTSPSTTGEGMPTPESRRHRGNETAPGSAAPENQMMGPSGPSSTETPPPPSQPMRHRTESGSPNGMTGPEPNAGTPEQGQRMQRMERSNGNMQSPNTGSGAFGPPEERRRMERPSESNPPNAGPGAFGPATTNPRTLQQPPERAQQPPERMQQPPERTQQEAPPPKSGEQGKERKHGKSEQPQ